MKAYMISFKTYDKNTVEAMQEYGLQPYFGRWGTRLCAMVRMEEKERGVLIEGLAEWGYFPEWNEVFENQAA